MSMTARYRQWSVRPTWAGSLGVGPAAGTHCRYVLMASGLIPESDRGVRHASSPLAARTVAVNPAQEWRGGELALRDYDLQFSGCGIGASPLPGSATLSWPACPSSGTRIWFEGDHATAQRFCGRGAVIDGSDCIGAGVGLQLLVFNYRWSALPNVELIRDMVSSALSGDIQPLRRNIPMGGICFGTQFGASLGFTLYQGMWWPSVSRNVTLQAGPDPSVGQPLPPGRRPQMSGSRARFQRRHW